MSDFGRTRSGVLYDSFYWLGLAMTALCVAFILAGNSDALWRFEHTGFPMSWAFGAIAVVSFLAAEICPLQSEASTDREQEMVPSELEAVEF